MQISTSDKMTVAGVIDLRYGADLQSLEFAKRVTAIRPYGSVQVHLSPDLIVEYRFRLEPDGRHAKGFDGAPGRLK